MAGRPRWWVTGLVVFLALALVGVGIGIALTHRGRTAVLPPPHRQPARTGASLRQAEASALLNRLTRALQNRSSGSAQRLGADASARRQLRGIVHNVRVLDITHLSMRYIDEQPGGISTALAQRFDSNAWVGAVDLTWRISGYDTGVARMETAMTFAAARHGAGMARFVTARGNHGHAVPLWLLDRLTVIKSPQTVTMAPTAHAAHRFAGLARHAVADVHAVLPRSDQRLVVEVPGSQAQLDRLLDARRDEYDEIAAVTTTDDGTHRASAPTHIFVNPPVFDPLGPRGAQVVLSHEATHVATGAATSMMPTWLLEGFADYVALDHAHVPVQVAASQIIGRVRRHGAPRHLPSEHDFGTHNPILGTEYEAAWLACRLLAKTYGEDKLVAFYQRANQSSSARLPFRAVFGTDRAAFTRAWRAYLIRLAG
jgi:hypothetical protein